MILTLGTTTSYAMSCNCDDWMEKGGYCVDYIKDRIPAFPIPLRDDMPFLKNTDVAKVTEGDVAVFFKNYWHVAYVEKVHRNISGEATAIDVSEKNFGGKLPFRKFEKRWRSNSRNEWARARCCGVSENYDRITRRENVPLNTVKQVWSPDDVAPEGSGGRGVSTIVDRAREAISRFFDYAESSL